MPNKKIFVRTRKRVRSGQDYTEDVETQLAQEILHLFHRYHLTPSQAKSLLEKVRVLVEAGELGFFQQSH